MTYAFLRTAVLVTGGLCACSRPVGQPAVIGPMLGESTAPGPAYPLTPPPDAADEAEVSAPLHGTPSPIANPAPIVGTTVDTMPPATEPTTDPANPAVVWAPSVPPLAPPAKPSGSGSPGQPVPRMPPPTSTHTGPAPAPSPTPASPPQAPPTGPQRSGTSPSTPGGVQR